MSSVPRGPARRLVWVAAIAAIAVLTPFWLLQWFPVTPGGSASVVQQPLRPAKEATSPTGPRFVSLPPSLTGITFQNELAAHNTHTYLTNGAGLAAGDYDNDGLPDLYFVSQDGPNRLYRQTAPQLQRLDNEA